MNALAIAALLVVPMAQPGPTDADGVVEEIRVTAERLYRDRAHRPEPVLIYHREFFQHFDPVTVGEMLKRVAAVAFAEDIGEYGAPQLRGLGAEYTQVLVNGQRVAGAGADRRVLVDRIPAELVERIEILRSPGADVDGQGVGGSIDIILRDGASLEGGRWEIGGFSQTEGSHDPRGNADLSWGRQWDDRSLHGAVHVQQRLFPKVKTQRRFDPAGELQDLTESSDRRDDTDWSVAVGGAWARDGDRHTALDLSHIDTTIEERERLRVLDADGDAEQFAEREDVDQVRSLITLSDRRPLFQGQATTRLSASRFREDQALEEAQVEGGELEPMLQERSSTDDDEAMGAIRIDWALAGRHDLSAGVGATLRQRRASERRFEFEDGETEDSTPGSGIYAIDEDRLHLFVQDRWTLTTRTEALLGLRVEHDRLDQRGGDGRARQSETEWLPSAHLLVAPDEHHQFRLGIARRLRRPAFDQLVPFTDEDSPDDDLTTIGNPALRPERSWGLDLGYEMRLGGGPGLFGINGFYRRIEDLIELSAIDEAVYTPINIGRGEAMGLELDVGLPLDTLGWRGASLYLNAAWLDSRVRDPFLDVSRRFNFQPRYVANLDLLHRLSRGDTAWGFSLQKQGPARSLDLEESKSISYGANLALFVERSFGSLRLRISLDNLLDARKSEDVLLFDGLDDLQRQMPESRVLEVEQIGPVLQVAIGGSF